MKTRNSPMKGGGKSKKLSSPTSKERSIQDQEAQEPPIQQSADEIRPLDDPFMVEYPLKLEVDKRFGFIRLGKGFVVEHLVPHLTTNQHKLLMGKSNKGLNIKVELEVNKKGAISNVELKMSLKKKSSNSFMLSGNWRSTLTSFGVDDGYELLIRVTQEASLKMKIIGQ